MASLKNVVESVLVRRDIDLEEIHQTKAGSRTVVRITIDGDGAEGTGLTLDDVAAASQEISRALDDSGVMGERPYVLEVGTRGVDKPLTKPAHWRRNIGRLVKVTRRDGDPVVARIQWVGEDEVRLSDDITIGFDQVAKAVVQVEMNRDEEKEE